MVRNFSGFSRLFHSLPKWIVLIFFIAIWKSHAQESSVLVSEEGAVILKWESSASLFRIQIRRDEQIFFDKEHGKNEIRLNLAPGLYEYRIEALNVFPKEDSSTAWLPLRVRSSRIPHFRLVFPLEIEKGEGGRSLVVESSKFEEDTSLYLVRSDTRISAEWRKDGSRYLVRLPDSIEAGRWDLEARDVSGKTFTVTEALTVKSPEMLLIHGLSVTKLPSEGTFPVEITGEHFDKNMSLRFEGAGDTLKPASTKVFNDTKALVYLDLAGVRPGDYTLVASNPDGVETRSEGALRVESAEMDTESESEEGKIRAEFHAGYSPMLMLFGNGKSLPVYVAVDIALLLQSGWEAPFLRGLGVETRVFGGISGLGRGEKEELVFGLDASVYYRPLLKGPISPVFLVGIGMTHSNYAAITHGINNISVIRAGLGMDITKRRWVTRVGASVSTSFDEKVFPIFSLMLRQGLRY